MGERDLTLWRSLRQLRSSPPGLAAEGERREVFSTALEQSQQLFEAASTVDYSVRPLLLFYGLSQAGKALAAAFAPDGGTEAWRAAGHGIRQAERPKRPLLLDVRLQQFGGAFQTICRLLGSDDWEHEVALPALWASMPAYRFSPLAGTGFPPALELADTPSTNVAGPFQGHAIRLRGIPDAQLDGPTRVNALRYIDRHYPTLSHRLDSVTAWEPTPVKDWPIAACDLIIELPREELGWPSMFARIGRAESSRDWFVAPSIGGGTPAHPLATWWAILFALSVRARYEPAAWISTDLNVDLSESAAWLEDVLDQAVTLVPALILDTIRILHAQFR